MSGPPNHSGSSSRREERLLTPNILISESDDAFFKSLYEFIGHELQYLKCPQEGPDELRYLIYRSVFNKVIGRATSYKRLLLTIKTEYDTVIRALQTREVKARTAQRSSAASSSRQQSLITCQRRAEQLRDRICILQRETAELLEETERRRSYKEQSTWIPGLTAAQSEDPEALDKHLKHLAAQRAALLDRKSHCVSLEVKVELDTKLQDAEKHRDRLSGESARLRGLYERLRFVSDRLSRWEDEKEPQVPLEERLGSVLENLRQTSVTDDDPRNIDAELFEGDEPTGVDESKQLTDDLHRFIELFGSAQYEEAALLAARAPRGVLRNLDTVDMFRGQKHARVWRGPRGPPPPLLLFVRALLMTLPAGERLSAALSLQAVQCVLQHGDTQLATHAASHNKLTFSEELGDVLTEHAQKNPSVTDLCLALATDAYKACRLNRKTALSMCRRGFLHNAAEFMKHCKELTTEDRMWVLCRSPSLSLLQLLTGPRRGRGAALSAGGVCSTLLANPQRQQLALQLLDGFVSGGRGVLEEVILQDSSSSVDVWTDVSSLCSELNRADLSRAIVSVVLDQSGTRVLTPDLEGARLMEHVFM